MLFWLKKQDGTIFYLVREKQYTVGRKEADILLLEDASVSRKHATIIVKGRSAKLHDLKSKYGTFHKGGQLDADSTVDVSEGDTVQFGCLKNVFIFERAIPTTSGSGLNTLQRGRLRRAMEVLGGKFETTWTENCTHLTAEQMMLTVKGLHAILENKPIVTLDYWDKFRENIKNKLDPPMPSEYFPPFSEALLDPAHLGPNPNRTTLFEGKTLVFTTDSIMSRMKELVSKTGGRCISFASKPIKMESVVQNPDKYIFITSDENERPNNDLLEIHGQLVKMGMRTIPIPEFAMAIYVGSCEQNCNPRFNRLREVFATNEEARVHERKLLALETQSQAVNVATRQDVKEIVIPATVEDNFDWSKIPTPLSGTVRSINQEPTKRSVVEDGSSSSEQNSFKRIKLDTAEVQRKAESISSRSDDLAGRKTVTVDVVFSQKRRAEEPAEENSPKKVPVSNTFESLRVNRKPPLKSNSASDVSNAFGSLKVARDPSRSDSASDNNLFAAFRPKPKPAVHAFNDFLTSNVPSQISKAPSAPQEQCVDANPVPKSSVNPVSSTSSCRSLQQPSSSGRNDTKPTTQSSAKPAAPKPTPKSPQQSNSSVVNGSPNTTSASRLSGGSSFLLSRSNRSEGSTKELDEDVRQIVEKFKNSAIVSPLPNMIVKRNSALRDTSNTMASPVKNFKKFKKVAPLRPQTRIISTSVAVPSKVEWDQFGICEDDSESGRDSPPIRALSRVSATTSVSKSRFAF